MIECTCRVVHSCKLFIVVSIKVLVLWISCVDGTTETERDVCNEHLTGLLLGTKWCWHVDITYTQLIIPFEVPALCEHRL